jgi:succinate dehydrogenase / fumarate reductase, membrane anchor subunit
MSYLASAMSRRRTSASGGMLGWYLMRLSGLVLLLLALSHYLILHVIYDPGRQNAEFVIQVRWSSLFWRVMDWALLITALFHGFLGMRTVIRDHVRDSVRIVSLTALYVVAFTLFVLGTGVVVTIPSVVPPP